MAGDRPIIPLRRYTETAKLQKTDHTNEFYFSAFLNAEYIGNPEKNRGLMN